MQRLAAPQAFSHGHRQMAFTVMRVFTPAPQHRVARNHAAQSLKANSRAY
jgi:hypothetical protein